MSTPDGLSQVGQIAITVHDLDRAVAFYRGTLGLPFLFSAPGMAFFDCGGVQLMLTLPESPEFDHTSSIIYFKVNDMAAQHERMAGAGVEFLSEPQLIAKLEDHDLWMAFFKDLDGNTLALMSELSLAGA